MKNLEVGSLLYRDYLPNITEKEFRSARLSVWYDTPKDFFLEENKRFKELVSSNKLVILKQKPEVEVPLSPEEIKIPETAKLSVYTDMDLIKEHLKSPQFAIVGKPEEADILWMNMDIFAQFAKTYKIKYLF